MSSQRRLRLLRTERPSTPGKTRESESSSSDRHHGHFVPTSPLDALDDELLVGLLLQDAHSNATEVLYRRHAGFALNLATRIAGSDADAPDVVHDAFLRAFSRLASLRNPKAFRSWLGAIVVREVRTRFRKQRWLTLFGLSGSGGSSGPGAIDLDAIISPDAPPHARAELAQVFALLRTLPANERIAWSLRYVEGFDLRQTAALCDCSLATVKRRIQRAQNHIKGHFVDPRESRSEEEVTTAPKTPSANNDEEAAS